MKFEENEIVKNEKENFEFEKFADRIGFKNLLKCMEKFVDMLQDGLFMGLAKEVNLQKSRTTSFTQFTGKAQK